MRWLCCCYRSSAAAVLLLLSSSCLVPSTWAVKDFMYDPASGNRPDNVTGLDYEYYERRGSYYNGTIVFTLNLEDPEPRKDKSSSSSRRNGKTCEAYINSTIEIEYNALLSVLERPTGSKDEDLQPGNNSVRIALQGWAKQFNLTSRSGTGGEGDIPKNESSSYQFFGLYSEGAVHDPSSRWSLNTSHINNDVPSFRIDGIANEYALHIPHVDFNLTDPCASGLSSPGEEYLFSGLMLRDNERDRGSSEDWASSIPQPKILGHFGNDTATVHIESLFSISNKGQTTELVGGFTASFEGKLDPLRSDQLLVFEQGGTPRWNATVGFAITSLVEGSGRRVRVGMGMRMGMTYLVAVVVGLLGSFLM